MVTPITVPIAKKLAQVMALVTLPRRITTGMNGSRAVRSLATNNIQSTAEPTSRPTMPHEAQPIAHAAPGERQHQGERCADHECPADNVEPVRPLVPRQGAQRPRGHHQRHGAERQVEPEDERPVQVIGQQSAKHRPEDAGAHEGYRDVALHQRALARREEVRR